MQLFTGRCLCGAVAYECGPAVIPPCFCHCETCRRASGAHVVAWATVRGDSFRVVKGALRSFASSPPVIRQFCERCGTPITYSNTAAPETIDLAVATLDRPDAMEPIDHVWMEDAAQWDRPGDGRPQFPKSRPM
jgi:hypothetical protein